MKKTNSVFTPGKLALLLDASAGSSGKGKAAAYVCENADNYQFLCNTFFPQASHTIIDDSGEYVYKQLNSIAHKHEKFEKIYIGHGSVISLKALLDEIKMTSLPVEKLGISPVTTILQDIDKQFEMGLMDMEGIKVDAKHGGTIKFGSTCSGVGAARARKALRKPNILLARDIEELKPYLCDVPGEIMERLDRGQSGLLEIAQGMQLSYGLPEFYPYCTSRNCTPAAALDDMMIPTKYAGNVILNLRTYPIRIHSHKYLAKEDGRHLTWEEVQAGEIPYDKIDSNSGPGWKDQEELTWKELTDNSGSPEPILECTTLTKLPRRPFTFSKENLEMAIKHSDTGNKIFCFLNFINYVDWDMNKIKKDEKYTITPKINSFIDENIMPVITKFNNVSLEWLGTGAHTDETIHYGS
jgi:adenylosuccinate synthase